MYKPFLNLQSESKGVWCYVLSTSNCYDKEVTWQKNSEDPNPPKHYYRSYEEIIVIYTTSAYINIVGQQNPVDMYRKIKLF